MASGDRVYAADDKLDQDARKTAAYLSYLQRPSYMEPAGSVGSFGVPLGVALVQLASPDQENRLLRQSMKTSTDSESILNPRLVLGKGTDWPIDFGLSLGQVQTSQVQTIAFFTQATVFEAFGLPALSLRGFWASAMGLQNSSVESRALELAMSQGVFGYINAYATGRLEQSDVSLKMQDSEYYGLTGADGVWVHKEQVNTQTYALGLKVAVAPMMHVVGEICRDDANYETIALKLGMLL